MKSKIEVLKNNVMFHLSLSDKELLEEDESFDSVVAKMNKVLKVLEAEAPAILKEL